MNDDLIREARERPDGPTPDLIDRLADALAAAVREGGGGATGRPQGVAVSTFRGTPGPWQTSNFDPTRVCDADGEVRGCSTIAITEGTARERKANAAAIAQIPAMVEALHKLCRAVDGTNISPGAVDRAYNEARAILAALREGGAV